MWDLRVLEIAVEKEDELPKFWTFHNVQRLAIQNELGIVNVKKHQRSRTWSSATIKLIRCW